MENYFEVIRQYVGSSNRLPEIDKESNLKNNYLQTYIQK